MPGWAPLSTITQLQTTVPAQPPGMPQTALPQNSGLAITSMVLGISAFLCGITALPAIICGHIALGKIKRSGGSLAGGGFAITGLITGYIAMVIVAIAMLAGLTTPMIMRQKKKADQMEAISNAKQIGYALLAFGDEFGRLPDATTESRIPDMAGSGEATGATSNTRFRQLIHSGITQSEAMFHARAAGIRKPDGDISGERALSPGECGFGYVENISLESSTPRPLAMTPFQPGSDSFDPMPFAGKAVILWSDMSVTTLPINRLTGEAILDGRNLLDPGHPVWGGTPPSLLLPE